MLTKALKSARHQSVKNAFRNESGAIDLASIMVGIIVIGIIGGVIAATVFAIIPWSQDNAAKSQLDSVATAESAYLGLSSDSGLPAYGDKAELNSPVLGGKTYKSLFDATKADNLLISTLDNPSTSGPDYTATITSASGKTFTSTNGGKAVASTPPATGGGNAGGGTPGGIDYGIPSDGIFESAGSYDQAFTSPGDISEQAAPANSNHSFLIVGSNVADSRQMMASIDQKSPEATIPLPTTKQFQVYNPDLKTAQYFMRPETISLYDGSTLIGTYSGLGGGTYMSILILPESNGNPAASQWLFRTAYPTSMNAAVSTAATKGTLKTVGTYNGTKYTLNLPPAA